MSTPTSQKDDRPNFFKGKTPRNALIGAGLVFAVAIGGLAIYYQMKQDADQQSEAAAKKAKTAQFGRKQDDGAPTGGDIDSIINNQTGDAQAKANAAQRPTVANLTPLTNTLNSGQLGAGGGDTVKVSPGGDADGIYNAGVFKNNSRQIHAATAGGGTMSAVAGIPGIGGAIGSIPSAADTLARANAAEQAQTSRGEDTLGQVEAMTEKLSASQNTGTGAASSQQSDLSFLRDVKASAQSGAGFSTATFVGQEGSCTLAPPHHIPVLTIEALNSDRPGTASLVVADDVYDSVTGDFLMIPKGSTIVAPYSSDIRVGAESILVASTELRLPNGKEVPLNGAQGADQSGEAGFSGNVNNHFLKIYGTSFLTAILLGVFDNKATTTTTSTPFGVSQVGTTAGQVAAQTSQSVLQRYQNIPPTITVKPGTRFMIKVNQDIHLEPYRD